MIFFAALAKTAYRVPRFYKKPTLIYIQVKHPTANLFFGTTQSEAQNGGFAAGTDGIALSAQNTNTISGQQQANPFPMIVAGELWYSADAVNVAFSLFETIGVTAGGEK